MNLMLILGSGISFPSGLPSGEDITKALFEDKWFQHTDKHYYPLADYENVARDIATRRSTGHEHFYAVRVRECQQLLRILKSCGDQYYQSRYPTERRITVNYEDLYYMSSQLWNEETGEIDNPAILPFCEQVRETARAEHIVATEERGFQRLARDTSTFIRDVVKSCLSASRLPDVIPAGLDLIHVLATCGIIEHLDLFTLNHDCLLERFLQTKGILFADGFGPPDGDVRYFDRASYDVNEKVRLFKLHGSIDWDHFYGRPGLRLPHGGWNAFCSDASNRLLQCALDPMFLVGTYNKPAEYTFGIYSEMHWRFHDALLKHDAMLVSGYGWKDRGINHRLSEWLSSGEKRAYILHQNPDEMIKESRGEISQRFRGFEQEGKIVFVKQWLCDAVEEMSTRLELE